MYLRNRSASSPITWRDWQLPALAGGGGGRARSPSTDDDENGRPDHNDNDSTYRYQSSRTDEDDDDEDDDDLSSESDHYDHDPTSSMMLGAWIKERWPPLDWIDQVADKSKWPGPASLETLACRVFAENVPFEAASHYKATKQATLCTPLPEDSQLSIAYLSFPTNESDLRLYSNLSNGSSKEFRRGQALVGQVRNVFQIGFLLTGRMNKGYKVSIVFDRKKITSGRCSCGVAAWCRHWVALCLFRMHKPEEVRFRLPVSESLMYLDCSQLRKLLQTLLFSHQETLPLMQHLIDQLRDSKSTLSVNNSAYDPTAGAMMEDEAKWCFNENILRREISHIIRKLKNPSTSTVMPDVYHLSNVCPSQASVEWDSLMKPLRARYPEGLWNLLSIVREMAIRQDGNAVQLLSTITTELMANDVLIMWWFKTNVAFHRGTPPSIGGGGGNGGGPNSGGNGSDSSGPSNNGGGGSGSNGGGGGRNAIYANMHHERLCGSLFDEIAELWRLVALDPKLERKDKDTLHHNFLDWHYKVLRKVVKSTNDTGAASAAGAAPPPSSSSSSSSRQTSSKLDSELDAFTGFKPALACIQINCDCDEPCDELVRKLAITATNGDAPQMDKETVGSSDSATVQKPCDQKVMAPSSSSSTSKDGDGDDSVEDRDGNVAHQPDRSQTYSGYWHLRPGALANSGLEIHVEGYEGAFDLLLARAEGLCAHGRLLEASKICAHLAVHFMENAAAVRHGFLNNHILMMCSSSARVRWGTPFVMPIHMLSLLNSVTLSKIHFICSTLLRVEETKFLAFRLALFGLEQERPPASTKSLEVKMAFQQEELMRLLRANAFEVSDDRTKELFLSRAMALKDGSFPLSTFPIYALLMAKFLNDYPSSAEDKALIFQAASTALGLKTHFSEMEHPLLYEGTRQHRGQLAITMLLQHKNESDKVDTIMRKLLCESNDLKPPTLGPNAAFAPDGGLLVPVDPINQHLSAHHQVSMQHQQQHPRAYENRVLLSNPPFALRAPFNGVTNGQGNGGGNGHTSSNNRSRARTRGGKARNFASASSNQPIESAVRFFFDMARKLLVKAGGDDDEFGNYVSGSFLYENQVHPNMLKCAFRLGLYSLELNNSITANWQVRTYSSHVSWVTLQSLKVGTEALSYLLDCWEKLFTPSEMVCLARRAFHETPDPPHDLLETAAKLALSCLFHVNTLSNFDVFRALKLCEDHSLEFGKQACLMIEYAALRDMPHMKQLLFSVARRWLIIHEKEEMMHSRNVARLIHQPPPSSSSSNQANGLVVAPQPPPPPMPPPPMPVLASPNMVQLAYVPPASASAMNMSQVNMAYSNMYYAPMATMNPYLHQYQGALVPAYSNCWNWNGPPPPPPPHQQPQPPLAVQPVLMGPTSYHLCNSLYYNSSFYSFVYSTMPQPAALGTVDHPLHTSISPILMAYRVGMLAMHNLIKIKESTPNPNPKTFIQYLENNDTNDHIKWLLPVAKQLGQCYLEEFSLAAFQIVDCPNLMFHIIREVDSPPHYMTNVTNAAASNNKRSNNSNHRRTDRNHHHHPNSSNNNNSSTSNQYHLHSGRTFHMANMRYHPLLVQMIQKCCELFVFLLNLCPNIELFINDFKEILVRARDCFYLLPDGDVKFGKVMNQLRLSPTVNKETLSTLLTALS